MSDKPHKSVSKIEAKLRKGKTPAPKSTKSQVDKRVKEIQALLLEGHTRSYILQHPSIKKWNIVERSIDDYIAKAWASIKEINQLSAQDHMSTITSQLWAVFRRAVESGNLSEQRQTLTAIAKLRGLDETTVNHVIEDQRPLRHMTDAELDAILEQDVNNRH